MTTPSFPSAAHVYRLGVKELWSLARDPMMLVLIVYVFSVAIYVSATAVPETLNNAPIAIVDEDASPLSARIASAFFRPHFLTPDLITTAQIDPGMDAGEYTFVLGIPPNFQRDVLGGKSPSLQLNVDATRMSQAFTGNNYVQQIVQGEILSFVTRTASSSSSLSPPAPGSATLAMRTRFNPNLEQSWFGSLMEIVNNVTMLSIVLTGAALIREREHGTIEHLLVMPITPIEIMLAKVWSMGCVVLVAATLSLLLVVRGVLEVPLAGSIPLFTLGVALHLFATTSMGIFLATVAKSMPQFGLLLLLILLPMQILSGNATPRESMPPFIRTLMLASPTTHFVSLSQAILFRGADLTIVYHQFLNLVFIGGVFFTIAVIRFRKTISQMV